MKKIIGKSFLKAGVAIFISALFLLTTVPVTASEKQLNAVSYHSNEPINDGFWHSPSHLPSSGLIYVGFPLIAKIFFDSPYIPMRVDWSDKPFPRPTLMWLGSGIGVRPGMPIHFILMGEPSEDVEFYSDGELYATLHGINFIYAVTYDQKGFHHLKFVPVGYESDTLEIDVQIGLNGFSENILPYLT